MVEVKKIILAVGGTGGHIFPAMAFAEELNKESKECIMIVDRRFKDHVKSYDSTKTFFLLVENILTKSLSKKFIAAIKLIYSCFQAACIILKFKPDVVIGFGGYPSFPTILVALIFRIPTIIHEQNTVMGRANRFLAKYAKMVALSFPNTQKLNEKYKHKTMLVGNPVREDIIKIRNHPYVAIKENFKMEIFIIGGSQGASIFTKTIPAAFSLMPTEVRQRFSIYQQARKDDLKSTIEQYQSLEVEANIAEFFYDVPKRLESASLVIARSGASTISELLSALRPAILVPLPNSINDHQFYNAKFFEDSRAGWLVLQENFSPLWLSNQLIFLLNNERALTEASVEAKKYETNAVKNLFHLMQKVVR